MPDSLPSSIAQTQTLPDEFAPVETWIDGLSNGEATILGFIILVTVGSFIVWLFSLKKDTAISPINIHPHITVEIPKAELPIVHAVPETSKPKIHLDRLPTVKGEFFGWRSRTEYSRLYSLWRFHYCDLLLAQNKIAEVLE